MDRKLGEFVRILRHNGLRVSPPEAADAAKAVGLVGYGSRQRFHDTLAATLVKSQGDRVVFERCFENFFRFGAAADNSGATAAPPLPADLPPQFGRGEGSGAGGGRSAGLPVPGVMPSALGELLLDEGDGDLELALARAAIDAGLANIRVMTQKGLFGRRLLVAMGLEELERELEELDAATGPEAALRNQRLRTGLDSLRRRVRNTVERYFDLVKHQDRDALLRETDFTLLRDSAEVTAVVRRMAKKLITRHRRREKQAARGMLDVRATLRRNLAHDGVLMDPHWRRLRKDRPRVMAVCDVSRSVSQHARFLLLFLYSLQEVIPQLRTFAFASSLHEVTPLFAELPVDAALDRVMSRYGLGSTDYGHAFADLEALAARDIDRRTTLIILGDARNNFGDARLDLLRLYHLRARQVIWLNPEDRRRWGSGDSEMLRYASACTHAYSCRTLNDLERIVDRLLKTT